LVGGSSARIDSLNTALALVRGRWELDARELDAYMCDNIFWDSV